MKLPKKKTGVYLLQLGVLITLVGLVTGRYFFIFLILPLGWFWRNKNTK
ncbi:hypothetical protein [Robertkochia marina]|nr:hypothetical protein [Robertkochia marina]